MERRGNCFLMHNEVTTEQNSLKAENTIELTMDLMHPAYQAQQLRDLAPCKLLVAPFENLESGV